MSKRPPVSVTVERRIDAPPEVIYDLVSDVTRMGEWSPGSGHLHLRPSPNCQSTNSHTVPNSNESSTSWNT